MRQSGSKSSSSRIRIAVRVRPLSAEEEAKGRTSVIERVNDNGVRVWDPTSLEIRDSRDKALISSWSRDFFYDHCLWSVSPHDSNFASQQSIYEAVGRPVVDFVLDGYNTCVLAYGQTGAGKSYTMLGSSRETSQYGLIPRICFSLFEDLEQASSARIGHEFSVDFSYLEIYNETLKDCLSPGATKGEMKLRESRDGIVVTNISTERVNCFEDVMSLIAHGNKYRTVAATNANARSSRSHAIVTLSVMQRYRAGITNGLPSSALQQKNSRVHLVDLAGSERQSHSGATGMRLREANNINKSLSVLGDVIKFLGEGKGHIPYRNSCLTMVLKESLGGNSHTAIVANVSPSSSDYDETISTLKYADSAKRIRMRVAANVTSGLGATDGSTALQLVPLLQAEVAKLKGLLKSQEGNPMYQSIDHGFEGNSGRPHEFSEDVLEMKARVQELESQLRDREDLIKSFADNKPLAREHSSSDHDSSGMSHISDVDKRSFLQPLVLLSDDAVDTTIPRIVNLNQDPLFSECLVYYIPDGFATAGSDEAEVDVYLSGPDVLPRHCVFHNHGGAVTIGPLYSASDENLLDGVGQIFVNGVDLRNTHASGTQSHNGHIVRLHHFDRVAIGRFHLFRFEAAGMHRSHSSSASPNKKLPKSAIPSMEVPDWEYAQNELMSTSIHSPITTAIATEPERTSKAEAPRGNYVHADAVAPPQGGTNVPTKSILRNSGEDFRRVRFSEELILEKMDKYSRPVDQAPHIKQQRYVPEPEAVKTPTPVDSAAVRPDSYWSRMDRIVLGTEKAANPAELRSMMRAALEMTSAEASVGQSSRYNSSTVAPMSSSADAKPVDLPVSYSSIGAPAFTTSPVKAAPVVDSAPSIHSVDDNHHYHSASSRYTMQGHEGTAYAFDEKQKAKPERLVRVHPPIKKPELAPEEIYHVDSAYTSVSHQPKREYDANSTGEKFDNEVMALQSELAQMQKNLHDRMHKYRNMGVKR